MALASLGKQKSAYGMATPGAAQERKQFAMDIYMPGGVQVFQFLPKGAKNLTKTKQTHHKWRTFELFQQAALCADLLFPIHFPFLWHILWFRLSGRRQE